MKAGKFISALAMATTLTITAVAGNNATQSEQNPDPIQEMKAAQERAKKEFEDFKNKTQDDYNAYKEDVIARYIAFRDSVLSEFVKQMKQPWAKTEVKPAIPKPKDRSVGPEIVPLEKRTTPQQDNLVDNTPVVTPKDEPKTIEPKTEPKEEPKPVVKEEPKEEPKPATEPKPVVKEEPKEEPKPVVKEEPKPEPKPKKEGPKATPLGSSINELKVKDVVDLSDITVNVQPIPFVPVIVPTDNEPDVFDFEFFGTPVSVRIDDRCRFTLSGVNNKAIANAMEEITKNELINVTLGDCIDLREDMKLCDWAYLEMLITLSTSFYGQECNEATLLAGYLYCMSGYQMRFAYNNKKNIELLFSSDQIITDLKGASLYVNGYQNFYSLNPDFNVSEFHVCNYAFPNEKSMSLIVTDLPMFDEKIEKKNIKLHSYSMNLDYSVNKNLIDFFDTYPTPNTEGDIYSKWTYYAKTPLSNTAKELLYPALKQAIEGKSEYAAVNIIIDWIETYEYEYDEKVWGYDRALFPDETLFYPYCDCEDRSILFTRIISDLLGLKTALIYYPGHLAAAVKFNGDVQGDYIMHNGEKYTVCDPTIRFWKAGRTMSKMNNAQATLILL